MDTGCPNGKMPVERSAGAVVFRDTSQGRKYLLLQHQPQDKITRNPPITEGHWDFPKGHIEKGEKTEDAVKREVKEEAGLSNIELVPGFKETVRYFVNYKNGTKNLKFVAYFLARAASGRVKISWEHKAHKWLPFGAAYQKITYKNSKDVLKKAHEFLAEGLLGSKENTSRQGRHI